MENTRKVRGGGGNLSRDPAISTIRVVGFLFM